MTAFLTQLEDALKDPLEFDMHPGEENIFVKAAIIEAARKYAQLYPDLVKLKEATANAAPEIRCDYDGTWDADYNFYRVAFSVATRIGEVVG